MNEAQDKSQDLSTRESSLVSEGAVSLEWAGGNYSETGNTNTVSKTVGRGNQIVKIIKKN